MTEIERLEEWFDEIHLGKHRKGKTYDGGCSADYEALHIALRLLCVAVECIDQMGDYCHTRCTPETPCGYHAFLATIETELGKTE